MNVRRFTNDTWDCEIHLVWPVTPVQFRNYVRRTLDKPKYETPEPFTAMCHSDRRDVVIGFAEPWTGSLADLGTLAHELLHATIAILRHCDTPLCEKTEEAHAYLLDSLFRNAMALLKS